jgi:Secretion system C-terminal sorting domain
MNNTKLLSAILSLFLVFSSLNQAQAQNTLIAHVPDAPTIVLALFDIPGQSSTYYKPGPSGLNVYQTVNGSYFVSGTIINQNNPNQRWWLRFNLSSPYSAIQWLNMGQMLQSDPMGCNPQDPDNMVVFEILAGSTLTGKGDFDGKLLNLYNINYGAGPKKNQFQLGDKGAVINCAPGAALWFAFNGSHTGTADFYVNTTDVDPGFYMGKDDTDCKLLKKDNTSMGLFGIPGQAGAYYVPGPAGVHITPINPTRSHIHGEIVNKSDPNQKFYVDYYVVNPKSYAEWIAMGGMVMSDPAGCATADPTLYAFWSIEPVISVLTGAGSNTGINLHVVPTVYEGMEHNMVQVGLGASVVDCDFGMAMWYSFAGTYSGTSDFLVALSCPFNPNGVKTQWSLIGKHAKDIILNIKNNALGNRKYIVDDSNPPPSNNLAQPQSNLPEDCVTSGITYTSFPDGTAEIKGNLVNIDDSNDKWVFYLPLGPISPYQNWSGTSYSSCTSSDIDNWLIHPIDQGTLIGAGSNVGLTLYVNEAPVYGMQIGEGASGQCGYGMGTWLKYTGAYKAHGDFHSEFLSYKICACGGPGEPTCTANPGGNPKMAIEEIGQQELSIFPNPATEASEISFLVEGTSENAKIEFFDISGRLVTVLDHMQFNNEPVKLSLDGILPGMYMVRVSGQNLNLMTTKLIVRR